MKKIMFTILFWGFMMLGLTGCEKSNQSADQSANISVTLYDNTSSIEVKVGDTLTYSLLGDEYEFEITDITEDEISIEVNQYGLTDSSSLRSKDNQFIIEKGKKLELHTQTTDYQESIIFEY